ncbi:MAG TPA: hypothetical protein ENJ40_02370 [Thermosulfurimonas dismutans]|uniref:Glycosyltransferase RgtA/B/C/D-like domain-containing protein n=1 Tax=Thermosulfurimonas dismutans TaxID=999894 RepID=A0A7C3CJK0_9BACT|nr:hypothetical protein [Thermosulfurimonas dismutans]
MKRETKLTLLLAAGVILFLFLNLGERPLWGVEGRWAEGVREMMLRGSLWVPTINWAPHITKPLIPYWLIRASAEIFGGLNEFTVRLPVAACGLLTLVAFYALARRFFEPYFALVATGMLATSWGFAAYARVAQSEIYQLAGIVSALAFYFYGRERRSFPLYLGFWLSAVFAALSKGLPGLAVPVLVAGIDTLLYTRGRHLNFKAFLAAGLALTLYLAHYYALSKALQSELPFHLFVRENLLQAVSPYDNREPFYVYFYYVPMLLLPWTFFFFCALIWAAKRRLSLSEKERLLLWAMGAIFLLFTLARARRSYYILPILPFCVLFTTLYLREAIRRPDGLSRIVFYAYGILTFILGLALLPAPLLWPLLGFPAEKFGLSFAVTAAGLLVLSALIWCMLRSAPPWGLILAYLVLYIVGLSVLTPALTPPSEKVFGRALSALSRSTGETPCALGKVSANLYFYLSFPRRIPVFSSARELPPSCRLVFFRESFYKKETAFLRTLLRKKWILYGLKRRYLSRDRNKNYLLLAPADLPVNFPFEPYS